jgi:2,5-diketo-D-gluconate reductase B
MRTIQVQGVSVPALGFGTFELPGRECEEGVLDALRLGYRHLDTASAYRNEREVGRALAASGVPRSEIFLTTKVWRGQLAYDGVVASAHASLERLGTDYVDLLLIHWPTDEVPLEESLRALVELRESGRTRLIGVSNFPPGLLAESIGLAPVANVQVEYHPYLGQQRLLSIVRQNEMFLTAYSPLARGRVPADPVLGEIGRKHGKSAVQVALRWLIDQERVVAIPKAASAEHRRANFELFDFDLSSEERARIGALERGRRIVAPPWSPDWEA